MKIKQDIISIESRIFIFPILGPQGAYKDQHIKEWKKKTNKEDMTYFVI